MRVLQETRAIGRLGGRSVYMGNFKYGECRGRGGNDRLARQLESLGEEHQVRGGERVQEDNGQGDVAGQHEYADHEQLGDESGDEPVPTARHEQHRERLHDEQHKPPEHVGRNVRDQLGDQHLRRQRLRQRRGSSLALERVR